MVNRYKQARHAMAYGMNKELIALLLRHDYPVFNLEMAHKVSTEITRQRKFTGNK